MRTAGTSLLNDLKSDTILKRKPFLKICSNHRRDVWPRALKIWSGGTLVRDPKGGYMLQSEMVEK